MKYRSSRSSRIFFQFFLIFAVSGFFSHPSSAYFEVEEKGKAATDMNGIRYDDYKDFTKTWHLVTVRYRNDSKELRFTYANDIAWKAMQSLKPNYPEGSVFGKIGMLTEPDPSFPSSAVPSGAKRVQFMVKNKAKYKSTDGWGYALFDGDGHLFKEDVKAKTQACAACHRIVPERDYVFSRAMALHYDSFQSPLPKGNEKSSAFQFIEKPFAVLPKAVQSALSQEAAKVQSIEGDIQKNAFSGTLDEIVPLLLDRAKETNMASALVIDSKNFSLVSPIKGKELEVATKCAGSKEVPFRVLIHFNSRAVRDAQLCH